MFDKTTVKDDLVPIQPVQPTPLQVLDARDFGLPRRRRLWIVGINENAAKRTLVPLRRGSWVLYFYQNGHG